MVAELELDAALKNYVDADEKLHAALDRYQKLEANLTARSEVNTEIKLNAALNDYMTHNRIEMPTDISRTLYNKIVFVLDYAEAYDDIVETIETRAPVLFECACDFFQSSDYRGKQDHNRFSVLG
jgi:hypothetical protein